MEEWKIKEIKLNLSVPLKNLSHGKKFAVSVKDDATVVDALAMVDKHVFEHPEESIFPIFDGYIHNYLQLFINVEEDYIYEDVGVSPYAPDEQGAMRKFNPIRDDLYFNLYPETKLDLQMDVGCWWEKVKNRLDIGKFKTIIRKRFGKNNEYFAHYYKEKEK